MKKNIYYLLIAIMSATCCISCNNEWENEQYTQVVSFKAEPNTEGVTYAYMRYYPQGKVTYNVPLVVSGSTLNSQSRTVHIGVDMDTMAILNRERYGNQQALYFRVPTSNYYSFPETVEIPAGQSTAIVPVEFALGDLDQSDKWVLPLTILDDPSYNYKANPRKYYKKALLRINPYNDYSGTYSGTLLKVILEGDTSNPLTLGEYRTYVADDKTIFLYAGSKNIDSEDRKQYKIFIQFTDEKVDLLTKKLNIYTDNPNIKLSVVGQPSYSKTEAMDATKPYLKHVYITLNLQYNFVDYTSVPGTVINYTVTGSLSMQRDLNTLIPDLDQQIQW